MLKTKRISEFDALRDLRPRPIKGVPMARLHGPSSSGNMGLGWHRGWQAGIIDAILTMQEMGYTRAATRVQKHYEMDDKGNITL
jgi:hypothetical protein